MQILITGGTGYIGSHICLELLQAGYEVVVLDNLENSYPDCLQRIEEYANRSVTFYEGDIRDRLLLGEIFSENRIGGVIHLAARKYINQSLQHPLEYYAVNVGGTVQLLEAMSEYGCRNLVFSSSASVYGTVGEGLITEAQPAVSGANPYACTKRMGEKIIEDYAWTDPDFRGVILRYFNPAGAHPSGIIGENSKITEGSLMSALLRAAAGEQAYLEIFGDDYPTADGTGIRDYIHVADLAKAHVGALQKLTADASDKGLSAGVHRYNMGTGSGCSVLQLVHTFEKVNGVSVPIRIRPRRDGDVAQCCCDAAKAKRELGWQTIYSLEDICRDAWNWKQRLQQSAASGPQEQKTAGKGYSFG